jgi:hypothetical protein
VTEEKIMASLKLKVNSTKLIPEDRVVSYSGKCSTW